MINVKNLEQSGVQRLDYVAPELTVVEVRNEQGYAASGGDGILGRLESEWNDLTNMVFGGDGSTGSVSTYEQHNEWGNEGWF